jgi:hypothetical protein
VTGVQRCNYSVPAETGDEFEKELVDFLKLEKTTGYEIRAVMNEIQVSIVHCYLASAVSEKVMLSFIKLI